MAQRSNRRQPVYSADALALRYICGLILAALGIMMFLAVELNMSGEIFTRLKEVCYGLTGGLAPFLPILPVWGGVLVIWSSQRKAPVKPFVYGCLAFLALCAFIVTVTRIGSEEYLAVLSRSSDGSWGGVIHQGFVRSRELRQSGGALGVTLAYPFWSLVGTILSAIVLFLALAACVMLALKLTPSRIRGLVTGKISLRGGKNQADRAQQDERQIAYQQEQERQRQMAYAQQQAYILQQQQQAAAMEARQQSGRWAQAGQNAAQGGWPEPAAGMAQSGRWPAAGGGSEAGSVREWQQELTNQAVSGRGRKSQIFDGGAAESRAASQRNTGRMSQIFDRNDDSGLEARQEEAPKKSRISQIFGGRRQEADGLSGLSAEDKRREGMTYPAGSRLRSQKPDPARVRMEQTEEDLNRWREPAEQQEAGLGAANPAGGNRFTAMGGYPEKESSARTQNAERPSVSLAAGGYPESDGSSRTQNTGKTAASPVPAEMEKKEIPAVSAVKAGNSASGRKSEEGRKPSTWMDQVIEAENETQEKKPAGRTEMPKPQQMVIPVVQESIKEPTWKPELKQVQPKEEDPDEGWWEPTPYYAPPITDLKKPDRSETDTTREDQERSIRLEETLASFQVQARVVHVTHGPAISRFELELAAGTKVGKVAGLERDIAYGMQATSVRIEAPIPGKSLVGVEVPNPTRSTVTLREILESPQMQNAKSILTVALGKDIAGTPVICDLAKMPHMLIAGATGSGKSVCINTIINSLLFRAGPDEVKLILVDPKVVELQCYNGIPHLLLPVVNDPHKAAAALAWAVAEMMERYDKFAERGVRNLQGYNAILEPGEKPLPRIVIIIDELADLMMVCKKDVEEYICRLTQLARAAGIHLIVATQRPSVDVITGLIKANIPSRIAFKTAQSVDSRTILDRNGSEQLLGLGDMLYLPTGAFAPTRVQGCFLSDEEVNRIADHVRQANPSTYDPNILDRLEQLTRGQEEGPGMDMIGGPAETGPADADLFSQAVEYAIADGQISTSTLQRRLKVGYARAGRLTDEMEERGIISAKDGSKPRKCLITREDWENMKASAGGAAAAG